MTLLPFRGVWPTVADDVFIAPGAMIIGDVHLAEGVSVWYNVVIRADTEPITIGARTNIQDGCVLHIDPGAPLVIGEDCTLGHSAVVHGAHLGDRVLVAMHATVLSHATIGDDVIIGAGAVIAEHKVIDSGTLALGVPGRIIRPLKEHEFQRIRRNAAGYLGLAQEHRASLLEAGIALD
jgi:gamma-carbonic anhydrase